MNSDKVRAVTLGVGERLRRLVNSTLGPLGENFRAGVLAVPVGDKTGSRDATLHLGHDGVDDRHSMLCGAAEILVKLQKRGRVLQAIACDRFGGYVALLSASLRAYTMCVPVDLDASASEITLSNSGPDGPAYFKPFDELAAVYRSGHGSVTLREMTPPVLFALSLKEGTRKIQCSSLAQEKKSGVHSSVGYGQRSCFRTEMIEKTLDAFLEGLPDSVEENTLPLLIAGGVYLGEGAPEEEVYIPGKGTFTNRHHEVRLRTDKDKWLTLHYFTREDFALTGTVPPLPPPPPRLAHTKRGLQVFEEGTLNMEYVFCAEDGTALVCVTMTATPILDKYGCPSCMICID